MQHDKLNHHVADLALKRYGNLKAYEGIPSLTVLQVQQTWYGQKIPISHSK
jgi:hypothetical protein